MRSHAKTSSAGSTQPQAVGLGHIGRRQLAVLAGLLLVALVALTAVATAEPPEYVKSFGPDGTATSDFERTNSVARDNQTGDVYVLDSLAGSLHKFDAEGQPVDWGGTAPYITGNRIDGLSPYAELSASQIAVDSASHVVYVTEQHSIRAFQVNGEPAEFTVGPGAGMSEIPGFGELKGLAVDANGSIYASDYSGTVGVYAATGEPITSISQATPSNLAVASDGSFYVIEGLSAGEGDGAGLSLYKFTPDTFPVTGSTAYTVSQPISISSGSAFFIGAGVDPVTDDVYTIESNFSSSWIRKYDSSGNFVRSFGQPGTPDDAEGFGKIAQGIAVVSGGLEIQFYVGNTEGFIAPDYSKVDIFGAVIVEGPPAIESTSAIAVTADSTTLRAVVNPNTAETTYRFEYGLEDCSLSACTSVPIGGATIEAGFEPVAVAQAIASLQAGTTYHYRVVAENSFGLTEGPSRTFTTQALGLGFQLADSRVWEMVSPPNKHGAQLSFGSVVQAAADGDGLAYASNRSIEARPDGSRPFERATVLARRGGDGWRSKDLTPPNARSIPLALGGEGEYKLFDEDLSVAMLEPRDGTNLSPQASERTPYLRENTEPPTYTPLVTGKEGFANVPPGTEFGGSEESGFGDVRLLGANPSFSHVVLRSLPPLVEGAPSNSIYVWSGGQLQPLSVLPAAEGGEMVNAEMIGSGPGSVRNAISGDGSRIFWAPGTYNSSGNNLTALYLRDTVAEETARLDVMQPGASGAGLNRPAFQGASSDGTVVFFTDSRQLTEDASTSGRDLYRCEIPPGPAPSGCASLTDVSAPIEGSGESAAVQGIVPGMSEDATRAYFVAKGVLDTEPNQFGDSAEAGEPNLYLWQQGEGARFIAALPADETGTWGGSVERMPEMSAAVSPSGRYLSVMSKRSLTGYVNLEATSAQPVQEVFRYDALTDRLDCVSCNPSGAAPEGQVAGEDLRLVDYLGQWTKNWVAAVIPQPTITLGTGGPSLYQPRAVLDNGRVFFNAFDSLVPGDSNGQWDVYQWEPTGVGDCSASSSGAAISRSAAGCVSLLSSGTAEEEAGFLDASVTGDDAFFLTSAKLSVTDEDEELDVYDARVNGVPATLSPRGECQGEACQPPAIPPADFSPASAFFEGPGNVRPEGTKRCAKGKRKVRRRGKVSCVARKQSKKQQRKARAGQERRAAR